MDTEQPEIEQKTTKWFHKISVKIIVLSLGVVLTTGLAIIAIVLNNNLKTNVDAAQAQLDTLTGNAAIVTAEVTLLNEQVGPLMTQVDALNIPAMQQTLIALTTNTSILMASIANASIQISNLQATVLSALNEVLSMKANATAQIAAVTADAVTTISTNNLTSRFVSLSNSFTSVSNQLGNLQVQSELLSSNIATLNASVHVIQSGHCHIPWGIVGGPWIATVTENECFYMRIGNTYHVASSIYVYIQSGGPTFALAGNYSSLGAPVVGNSGELIVGQVSCNVYGSAPQTWTGKPQIYPGGIDTGHTTFTAQCGLAGPAFSVAAPGQFIIVNFDITYDTDPCCW